MCKKPENPRNYKMIIHEANFFFERLNFKKHHHGIR